jgi:phage terminase Nu1 subunit (DNA packaging protein)
MIVNRRQLANIFGITLPTVDAWRQRGMPYAKEGGLGREWEFDTAACIEWHVEQQSTRLGAAALPDGVESFEHAERRKMIAQADRAEVLVAKDAGLLVPIDEVAAVVAEENARVRARILGIPNELRPKVMTFLAQDRKAAEQLISDAEAIVLEALGEIRSWAPEPDDAEV